MEFFIYTLIKRYLRTLIHVNIFAVYSARRNEKNYFFFVMTGLVSHSGRLVN